MKPDDLRLLAKSDVLPSILDEVREALFSAADEIDRLRASLADIRNSPPPIKGQTKPRPGY